MKREQKKLGAKNVDILYCSGMSVILRKSFAVLILCNFLIKQKVELISIALWQVSEPVLFERKDA